MKLKHTYKMMKFKTILIISLSLVVIQTSFAKDQKKKKKVTVSGVVVDGNGKPIPGVTIIVDGKTINKVTNTKGFYKIKISPETKTLMMYSLFHEGLEVDFKGNKKINFILAADIKVDREKVATEHNTDDIVDTGYGLKTKKDITNSTSKGVKEDEMSSSTKYHNIFEMIQSRFPGVNVNVSRGTVTIRGKGSLQMSSQALFVVDGMPISSPRHINPSQVKSMSLLKGAAASAYGMQGSNGVILITTKSGK